MSKKRMLVVGADGKPKSVVVEHGGNIEHTA